MMEMEKRVQIICSIRWKDLDIEGSLALVCSGSFGFLTCNFSLCGVCTTSLNTSFSFPISYLILRNFSFLIRINRFFDNVTRCPCM